MRRKLVFVISIALVLSLTACGSKEPVASASSVEEPVVSASVDETPVVAEPEPSTEPSTAAEDTLGSKYLNAFVNSSATTVTDAANELVSLGAFESELVLMDVTPGYLNGFSDEVIGFSSAAMFSPMIGSIPFVGYVFEVENPEEFLASITAISDPRWNICTEADETVSATRGNLVFFLMCSNEEEW